jgi:hypothetical protein
VERAVELTESAVSLVEGDQRAPRLEVAGMCRGSGPPTPPSSAGTKRAEDVFRRAARIAEPLDPAHPDAVALRRDFASFLAGEAYQSPTIGARPVAASTPSAPVFGGRN